MIHLQKGPDYGNTNEERERKEGSILLCLVVLTELAKPLPKQTHDLDYVTSRELAFQRISLEKAGRIF